MTALDDDIDDITPRQREMLATIVDWIAKDPLKQPPSQRDLLEALNERLPKRADKKPPLAGIVQVSRLAEQLRRQGLLVDISKMADQRGRYRNLVPTAKGERLARQWRKEETPK